MPAAGIDGFLGTRASLMLDLVVVAMAVVLPVLGGSIALVKYRHRYQLHKRIQLVLGAVLLVTVLAFEADMRINGWRQRAAASRFWGTASAGTLAGTTNWVDGRWPCIFFSPPPPHCFGLSSSPERSGSFRVRRRRPRTAAWHRRWGKLAAIDMLLTALTGWLFYWMAFVA